MSPAVSKENEAAPARVFLALEIPVDLAGRLAQVQTWLGAHSRMLRWVPAERMHVTVRFLGTVSRERLTDIRQAASNAAAAAQPFVLGMSRFGAFPRDAAPRVLWFGPENGAPTADFDSLFELVEERVNRAGFSRETRKTTPHITLARVRDGLAPAERTLLAADLTAIRRRVAVAAAIDVDHLTVMESVLSPAGPVYHTLARYRLGGGVW